MQWQVNKTDKVATNELMYFQQKIEELDLIDSLHYKICFKYCKSILFLTRLQCKALWIAGWAPIDTHRSNIPDSNNILYTFWFEVIKHENYKNKQGRSITLLIQA